MTTSTTLQEDARALVRDADFVTAWPAEVKSVLVRTLRTQGELPPYAIKEVRWAIKEAGRIERKFAHDIAQGLASLPTNDPRRRAALAEA